MTKSIKYTILILVLCQSCAKDTSTNDFSMDDEWHLLEQEASEPLLVDPSGNSLDTNLVKSALKENLSDRKEEFISNILDPNYRETSSLLGLLFSETQNLDLLENDRTIYKRKYGEDSKDSTIRQSSLIKKDENQFSKNTKVDVDQKSSYAAEISTAQPTANRITSEESGLLNRGKTLQDSILNDQPLTSNAEDTSIDNVDILSNIALSKPRKQKSVGNQASINYKVEDVPLEQKIRKNSNIYKRDDYENMAKSTALGDIQIRALHKVSSYSTNEKHTLLIEIRNQGKKIDDAIMNLVVPESWDVISVSKLGTLNTNSGKKVLVSFYLPSNAEVGIQSLPIYILDKENRLMDSGFLDINVAPNYDIDVFNVSAPQNVRAGEVIKATYAVKNMGNITQNIILSTSNVIEEESKLILEPNSLLLVKLSHETNANDYTFRHQGTNLEVLGIRTGQRYKAFKSVEVFPVKIKKEEIYFKFPVRASLYYNSYTSQEDHFSTMSFEVSGSGNLDLKKDHFLDFIVRGPRQTDIRQFGNNDQYSLKYRYKDRTTVRLGDHSYFINRLGINGKFGMGFKVDQRVNDWTFSAFYTKPRLYDYDAGAYYGIKSVYHTNPFMKLGVSLTRSKRMITAPNQKLLTIEEQEGEILTLDMDYSKKGTRLVAESSASSTDEHIDFAQFVNLRKTFGRYSYSGSVTISGENYFGTINNSLQFTNALNYRMEGWNFGLGQSLSRVNQRLNPLYYSAEPYYENYFATLGYRFNRHHTIRMRIDKRVREDQLEPKNYHYKENGFNYSYGYENDVFTANFNGRIGKTKNLLSEDLNYRNTYSHNINLSYGVDRKFRVRGGLNHNYTNRYGKSSNNLNYVRYNLGFNYKFSKKLLFNANFNSGFSPEDSYLKRDFISLNLVANMPKNHQFEIRANYFEYPGVIGNREVFAYGKYTYSFGVPIKKIKEQGGIMGHVISNDKAINTSGVKIIATGKTVMTDKDGRFEIQNLPLGKNYILVEQSSLDQGVITSSKIPYEVIIEENRNTELNILLVNSSIIEGQIEVNKLRRTYRNESLEGFIKLENKDFTYYTESKRDGTFNFHQIVPGTYELTLMRLKENDASYYEERTTQITLKEGEIYDAKIFLNLRERKIKFKNKNFKVGNYE